MVRELFLAGYGPPRWPTRGERGVLEGSRRSLRPSDWLRAHHQQDIGSAPDNRSTSLARPSRRRSTIPIPRCRPSTISPSVCCNLSVRLLGAMAFSGPSGHGCVIVPKTASPTTSPSSASEPDRRLSTAHAGVEYFQAGHASSILLTRSTVSSLVRAKVATPLVIEHRASALRSCARWSHRRVLGDGLLSQCEEVTSVWPSTCEPVCVVPNLLNIVPGTGQRAAHLGSECWARASGKVPSRPRKRRSAPSGSAPSA